MIILFLCCILTFSTTIPTCFAVSETTYFARIMQENVPLFKTAVEVEDFSNIYFNLPKTYFVELLDKTPNGFFKVNYLGFVGFIKKDAVQTIVGTPSNPFLTDINFRVYSEQSRDLRTEPSTKSGSSSQVAYIPLLSRNLTYFGTIVGEQLIDGRTNIWYYCKYSADQNYYGYVYSDFCDELTPILDNQEQVQYTTEPNFNPSTKVNPTSLKLENKTTSIIIAVLSLPAIAFMLLIFKNKKIVSKSRHKNKEVVDY